MEAILNAPCRVQNFEGEVMEWARAGTCGCERFRVEKNGRLLGRGAGVIELRVKKKSREDGSTVILWLISVSV